MDRRVSKARRQRPSFDQRHPMPTMRLCPDTTSKQNWKCPKCSSINPKAHERTILDHFLLHQQTITNKECRNLLQIDSPRMAYNFLNSMNLRKSGNNRGRIYYSPSIQSFPQNSKVPVNFQHHFAKLSLD